MNLNPFNWSPREASASTKYDIAMRTADETIQRLRAARESKDPIRALLADVFFQHHDTALVADAYEASQESRIYKGPP